MKTLIISFFKTHLLTTISIIASFFVPIRGLIFVVGFCIVADTIFGIYKAKRIHDKITSRKLSKIISKMLLYEFCLILFFVIDLFVLGDFVEMFVEIKFFLTKVVAVLLCFIEIKSIDESFKLIFKISLWEKLKQLVARGGELKEELEDLTKKKDE